MSLSTPELSAEITEDMFDPTILTETDADAEMDPMKFALVQRVMGRQMDKLRPVL